MKLTLCVLALVTLASSRLGYKEPSMSERCSRTMKNFFLTACAKELEDSHNGDRSKVVYVFCNTKDNTKTKSRKNRRKTRNAYTSYRCIQKTEYFDKLVQIMHHFVFEHLDMNTYVPVRKIIKVVATQRNTKRERRSSVQECFETGSRRRSRWNPCIILFCLLSAAIYLFHHRAHYLPDRNKQVVINEIHYDAPPSGSTKSSHHHITQKKLTQPPPLARPNTANTRDTTENIPKKDYYKMKTDIIKGPGITAKKYPGTELPLCIRKRTYSKFEIKMKSVSLVEENVYPLVGKGGSYHPPDCKARFKVGIVVPYRSRAYNLGIFLYNIHPFLMRQKLNYQIFVIEQHGDVDLFNKGRLLNAGFNEMMKFNTFNCVVFHDLDLLPMNDNIAYNCPTLPRHMCSRVNDTELKRFYPSYTFKNLFGGVVSMTREQFERANGYSNLYFGWGAEDNDMFWRLRAAGYPIVRYNSSIGVYLMLPHTREQANPYRHHLLSSAVERYKIDGLSNSEYYVMSTQFLPLFTRIIVDINPRGDNVTDLNIKWSKNKYH